MEQSKKEECCDIRVNGGLQSPDCCHQPPTKRQDGFYWVQLPDYNWEVAEFKSNWWWIAGVEIEKDDDHFVAIDEIKLTRL